MEINLDKEESDQLKSLEEFQEKIKILNLDLDEEFNKFLKQFGNLEALNQDKGVLMLINEFYQSIENETSTNRKTELFTDLVKELTAHLAKKPTIRLSIIELKKRKDRTKKVKQQLLRLDKKIKYYENKELELDDLEEEDNALIKIQKLNSRIIKLYKELRQLENKHLYFGNDEFNFNDLTDHQELNKILNREILSKFTSKNLMPDFVEVQEIVDKFSNENGILLDSKFIFKKIGAKLKKIRSEQVNLAINSYLDPNKSNEFQTIEEDEELKSKLDSQNHFKNELDELVNRFVKRVEDLKESGELEESKESEDSEDSESDSVCEDSIDTISEDKDEFIATIDDLELSSNGSSEEINDNLEQSDSKNDLKEDELKEDELKKDDLKEDELKDENFLDNEKRKLDELEESDSKKVKIDDCIILD